MVEQLMSTSKETFAENILSKIQTVAGLPKNDLEEAKKFIGKYFFWEAANILGQFYNREKVSDAVRNQCRTIIVEIRDFMGGQARISTEPTTIVFGTSGWRGVIGQNFTLFNIHKVLRAITELLKSDLYIRYNNFTSFKDVQQKGMLLTRDNRYMGDVWIEAAKKEMTSQGIRVFDAGMCPTGVGSAYVKDNKLAGLINFTPSHNPMEYAGIKFNPADGGGSESDLSSVIEDYANKLMSDDSFKTAEKIDSSLLQKVDAGSFFRKYIEEKSIVFDLPAIRKWLRTNKNDFFMVVDFMHGSSRGYIQQLLGQDLWDELKAAGAVLTRHEDEDYSFHGMRPEPSAVNQKPIVELLKKKGRKFTFGCSLDPDADRIRFADADMDIDMNLFAAIAYAGLLQRNIMGDVVTSLPSSGFTGKIARSFNHDIVETAVGFKNFRSQFLSGKYSMGFEESDGISFIGHTLEKCALSGFLAGLTAISTTNKNLSEQYTELQKKYGYFYPERAGVDVRGVSVEEWQAYKKAVINVLQHKLYKKGDKITIAGVQKTIVNIVTIDGLKVFMDDDSWILMRPSGTEPKFRYYYEVVSDKPLANPKKELDAYNEAASAILQKARDMV
jgi:phosphomannomutase